MGVPEPLVWTLSNGVHAAFSELGDGDQREPSARERFLARIGCRRPCAVTLQVHGRDIVAADLTRPPARADGLVTSDPGIAVMVFGADCPGLCLVAADAMVVAHCGWRGTAAGIVSNAVEALAEASAQQRGAWQALIGPGIDGRDYEVDAPVLCACTWPVEALAPSRPGHSQLDLGAAIRAQLAARGISAVRWAGTSTSSDPRLWSYRKRGAGPVQGLVAWRS